MSYTTRAPALPNIPTPRIISKYFKAGIVVLPFPRTPERSGEAVTASSPIG
jgi:hypothetical protein